MSCQARRLTKLVSCWRCIAKIMLSHKDLDEAACDEYRIIPGGSKAACGIGQNPNSLAGLVYGRVGKLVLIPRHVIFSTTRQSNYIPA